jgi:peptide/nickel transport system ATP-binding protein
VSPSPSGGLHIANLTMSIRDAPILGSVDLNVPAGSISGLAGESGSGKSITALTVVGLQPPEAAVSGAIEYGGRNLLVLPEPAMNRIRGKEIAMIFQDPTSAFHPLLRIGTQLTDHARHHLGSSRREARERALQLLHRVQVPDPEDALRRYPHQFSGGQLQRVAIASALMCEPSVLIADEPTTALDVTVQAGILRLLRGLSDDLGLATLLITHDLAVLSAVADTITVMRQGRVVETGSRFDVITRPQHPYTRDLINSLPNRGPRPHDDELASVAPGAPDDR